MWNILTSGIHCIPMIYGIYGMACGSYEVIGYRWAGVWGVAYACWTCLICFPHAWHFLSGPSFSFLIPMINDHPACFKESTKSACFSSSNTTTFHKYAKSYN